MIFQDFHERVRQGKLPSLELDGMLPEIAMKMARTTFVPRMTPEEMKDLFGPTIPVIPTAQQQEFLRKQQEILQSKPIIDKISASIAKDYNTTVPDWSDIISRPYLVHEAKKPFMTYYDAPVQRYFSLTGEEFLNELDRYVKRYF